MQSSSDKHYIIDLKSSQVEIDSQVLHFAELNYTSYTVKDKARCGDHVKVRTLGTRPLLPRGRWGDDGAVVT